MIKIIYIVNTKKEREERRRREEVVDSQRIFRIGTSLWPPPPVQKSRLSLTVNGKDYTEPDAEWTL